jgi:hypothetical protein
MATSAAVRFLLLAVAAVAAARLQAAFSSPPPPPPPPFTPETGRPRTCSYTLSALMDCEGFLSTGTALAGPPASCCGNLRTILGTPSMVCLCHVYGGEVSAALGINVDPLRLALLPLVCLAIVPPQLPYICFGNSFFSYQVGVLIMRFHFAATNNVP